MILTCELVSGIPGYLVEMISENILGANLSGEELARGLGNEQRLQGLLDELSADEEAILLDLFLADGELAWPVLAAIRPDQDVLRSALVRLGNRGLVFQEGLTGRDPVIMLPVLKTLFGEYLLDRHTPPADTRWQMSATNGLWSHVVMLNTVRAERIRCRASLEPFKKGWQVLHERLGDVVDVERIYWEVVNLGCLQEEQGAAVVRQEAALGLAMEGEVRYRVWEFVESCRAFHGLETRVLALLGDGGSSRDLLTRAMEVYLAVYYPGSEGFHEIAAELVSRWVACGVLQTDESGAWVCLCPEVVRACLTGEVDDSLQQYQDEVVIQPNLEILVPMDFEYVDHLNVGEMADIVRADVASIYRISHQSVLRALKNGWTAEQLLNFLERISRHTVPANVQATIASWAERTSRGRVITGTFLVMQGEEVDIPGLEEELPGIYRLPPARERAHVRTLLEQQGVILEGAGAHEDEGDGPSWGHALPLKPPAGHRAQPRGHRNIYPFGMVTPLAYGPRALEIFEEAIRQSRPLVIFYPKKGYGEIQVRKITPVYLYVKGGVPFVEAFCEDTQEAEDINVSKVRALFRSPED